MSILKRAGKSATQLERSERPKRILVIGSDGHGRTVLAHPWDQLPKTLNVADYEVVILNFAAFEDQALAEGFPVDRLPDESAMARLLFSRNSEIVAIGDPKTLIGPPSDSLPAHFDGRQRADYWLPLTLPVEDNIGKSYSVASDDWRLFFDQLSGWRWILSSEPVPLATFDGARQYIAPVTDRASSLSFKATPVAETRFQKPIAIKLEFIAEQIVNSRPVPILPSGSVYWLPAPDRLSVSEAIDLLLRERYGIAEKVRAPNWIGDYPLPAEAPIGERIDELKGNLAALEEQLSTALDQAEGAAKPKRLLFEKGRQTLEPIVRDALREIGARVEEPERDGIEDGLLFHNERAAIIEIKGREGGIKQSDIRQAVQWASDAKLRDGVPYKPLIVANPYCETKLEERKEPLTGNAKSYAENGEVGLLTTVQLYEALRQYQLEELDIDAFWDAIFNAVGVADLPGPDTTTSTDAPPRQALELKQSSSDLP
jgi:hypothetical protein